MATGAARRHSVRVVLGTLAALTWCAAGLAQVATVFSARSPMAVASGPDGAMWFADGSAIGRIDSGGAIARFEGGGSIGAMTWGPDGNLWYTLRSPGRIGRMTPAGARTEFALPSEFVSSFSIVAGPDGKLWFTEPALNKIGRITTSGSLTEFDVPTTTRSLAKIASGHDGNLWFTEFASGKICRITTSGVVTEFDAPTAGGPAEITAGPDGNVWFVYAWADKVGRVTPNGDIQEFPLPGGGDGIVAGPDGNLWLTRYDALRRLTTTGAVTEYRVPGLFGLAAATAFAPDGAIWIAVGEGAEYAGAIVRIALQPSACVASATTLCLKGGRFRVTVDWRAADGSFGRGRGVNLTPNSGYFWFFDPTNIELIAKILDGCSVNQHHWAFAAGLTDLEVTTTITDMLTGIPQVYTNPLGAPFAPIQDTRAFSMCP